MGQICVWKRKRQIWTPGIELAEHDREVYLFVLDGVDTNTLQRQRPEEHVNISQKYYVARVNKRRSDALVNSDAPRKCLVEQRDFDGFSFVLLVKISAFFKHWRMYLRIIGEIDDNKIGVFGTFQNNLEAFYKGSKLSY